MNRTLALLRDGLDRTTIYLPVILAGVLALGTYWLVRNAPKLAEPSAPRVLTHDPDYFMRGFIVKTFLPSGELRSELSGKEGRHYPDTDTIEVDHVRLRSIAATGLVTRAQADRGISNADATEVQLLDNAIVVRDAASDAAGRSVPRLEFRGEFLHAFTDTERVRSNKPVILMRGEDRFTADTMDFDHLGGVLDLQGRVRGTIMPATSKRR